MYKLITFSFLLVLASAEEHQPQQYSNNQQNYKSHTPSGFTIGKTYSGEASVLPGGTFSGNAYGVIGISAGPKAAHYSPTTSKELAQEAPNIYYENEMSNYAAQSSENTSLFSSKYVNYYALAGVAFGGVLLYLLYFIFFKSTVLALKEVDNVLDAKVDEAKDETQAPATKKERRRREIKKNEEAARLAQIVLSAIESGECLEESICYIGSQLAGTERGKLAAKLLEKLVPTSVQKNNYFTILKKALLGLTNCDKYQCHHH